MQVVYLAFIALCLQFVLGLVIEYQCFALWFWWLLAWIFGCLVWLWVFSWCGWDLVAGWF